MAAVFVSHGSPMIALEPSPARDFLRSLGERIPRPRAILVATAHWETEVPTLSADPRPTTVHDFGGFPEALYALQYPAPGSAELAGQAAGLLAAAGLAPKLVARRGFDHGTWTPLLLAFPEADVPVVQLSVQPHRDAAAHLAVGRALAPLAADGVLVLGSGSLTHDLGRFWGQPIDAPADPGAIAFAAWIAARLTGHETAALLDWPTLAPGGRREHPSPEHLLPLFVALGAGGERAQAVRLHQSITYGALAMDAWQFTPASG